MKSHKMVNINQKMVNILYEISRFRSLSINNISKKLKEPYTSVHRIIKRLISLDIVNSEEKGKSILVSINIKNDLARYLCSIADYFKSLSLSSRYPLFSIILKEFQFNVPLILFGSYAKGKETSSSDIDLCTIGLPKNHEKIFKRSLSQIELIHKIKINCLFFKKAEFTDMLKSKSHNVGKEILLNNLALKNADLWYNYIYEVYDDIRL
jgi:predicted nucleotidyltransferase/DNA-binding transcriptional ArsR family regulator